MDEMIDSETDQKNIGLLKNLFQLRQALDAYCLISVNGKAIQDLGVGRHFFGFVRMSCQRLIVLYICKVYEKEKPPYELDSIDGVLGAIDNDKGSVLDSDAIRAFARKYKTDSGPDECGLQDISAVVTLFRQQHGLVLDRFKTLRDKWVAHGEYGFVAEEGPSYHDMECLFEFGRDFYMLISRALVSVGPYDLNAYRDVKVSLKNMLQKLGCEEIKTDME